MKKKTYTGINIQYPISRLILDGKKSIETRTYQIPPAFIGKELLLVETPGHTGKFKARVIAILKFEGCFLYNSKEEFYRDSERHCVKPGSPWEWNSAKKKWGWPVTVIKKLKRPVPITKRLGIKYTKYIEI